jgi:hypothetical protein
MKAKVGVPAVGVRWFNQKWAIWSLFALLSLVTLSSLIEAQWLVARRIDGWVWVDGKLETSYRLYSRSPGVVFVQSDGFGYMFFPYSEKVHVVYRIGLHETPWALYCDDELQVQPAEFEPLGDWIPNMKEVETKYGMATVFTTIDGKRVRFVVDYR